MAEFLRSALIFALAVVSLLGLDVYLFHVGALGFGAYWFDVGLVAVGMTSILLSGRVYSSAVAALLACYAGLSLLHLAVGGGDPGRFPALQVYLFSFAFLFSWTQLLADERLYRAVVRALWCALVVAATMNLYEVFQPRTWSDSYGRSAGFLVNPNHAGRFGALGATFLLATGTAPLVAFLLGSAVIFPTLSRGALLAWALVLLAYLAFDRAGHRSRGLFALLALLVVASGSILYLAEEGLQISEMSSRLSALPGTAEVDLSASSRHDAAMQSLDRIADRPLFGHGPDGVSLITWNGAKIGPHNEFLLAALNFGLIGLGAWAIYLARLARGGSAALALCLAALAITFHDLAANRQVLMILVLVEAARRHGRGGAHGTAATGSSPCAA